MKVVERAKFCVVVLKVCKLTFLRKVNTYEAVNLVNLILPNLYKKTNSTPNCRNTLNSKFNKQTA